MSAPGLGDVYAGRPDYGDDVAPCLVCGDFDELDERGECSTCHRGECEDCGDLTKVDREGYCDRCRCPDCGFCGQRMTPSEVRAGHCAACWRECADEERALHRREEGR